MKKKHVEIGDPILFFENLACNTKMKKKSHIYADVCQNFFFLTFFATLSHGSFAFNGNCLTNSF